MTEVIKPTRELVKPTRRSFLAGAVAALAMPAVFRTVEARASFVPGPYELWIDQLGAQGDGVTDDTAAFNRIAAFLPNGGRVRLGNGKNYLTSSGWTVPVGVSIHGPYDQFGMNGLAASQLANYRSITLGSGATISMSQASTISGCAILPQGMTFPQSNPAGWTGTAINTVARTGALNTGGSNCCVENSMIAGFNQAFISAPVSNSDSVDRVYVRHCAIDCNNGVDVSFSEDISRFEEVHCWPFLTFNSGVLTRSGTAFKFSNSNDHAQYIGCAAVNFNIGFDCEAADSLSYIGCDADGVNTYGFLYAGFAGDVTYDTCKANTAVNGFYISSSYSGNAAVTLSGCLAWSCANNGVGVDSSNLLPVVITGGNFHDNAGWGINSGSSHAKSKITVNGAAFAGNSSGAANAPAGQGVMTGGILNGQATAGFVATLTTATPPGTNFP